MRIVTYRLIEAPAMGPEFLAFIATGDGFLPIRFGAPTEDAARAKAQKHWDEAMAKQAALGVKTKPKPKPAAAAAQIDEEEEAV